MCCMLSTTEAGAIVYILILRCNFFFATCNANLGEKDTVVSSKISDICKLLCDMQCYYYGNYRSLTGGDFSCNLQLGTSHVESCKKKLSRV